MLLYNIVLKPEAFPASDLFSYGFLSCVGTAPSSSDPHSCEAVMTEGSYGERASREDGLPPPPVALPCGLILFRDSFPKSMASFPQNNNNNNNKPSRKKRRSTSILYPEQLEQIAFNLPIKNNPELLIFCFKPRWPPISFPLQICRCHRSLRLETYTDMRNPEVVYFSTFHVCIRVCLVGRACLVG